MLVAIVLVLLVGTVGFRLSLDEPWLEAFYRAVVSASLTGIDSVPDTDGARILTIFMVVAGISIYGYVAAAIVEAIAGGIVTGALAERRRERTIRSLQDHYIICGYGRIGSVVARQFQRQHVPFVVVERDPERMQLAMDDGKLAVEADASREEVLKRVGIDRARGLVAAVGTDAENVYAVLSARVMRPDLFIVSRAETEDAKQKLKRAGADRVISPYQIGAQQMALTALRPPVVDFVQLATSTTSSEQLDLAIEQVKIGSGASYAGKSIVDANLRQRFGVVIVGIQRRDGKMDFNPAPDALMQGGDQLIVMGRSDGLKQLESMAQGAATG